jgi:hypothetical protein
MSPSFKGWDENLLDIGGETLAVDGAVDHERRVDPIAAEGCDKGHRFPVAMVFQSPCGALATSLQPFGPQPRSGDLFVLTQVSSMKTRRAGSMLAWCAFQRSRLRATSGRSCSLANRLFFETQTFLANESPNRAPIGLDPALRQFGRQARVVNRPEWRRWRSHTATSPESVRGLRPPIAAGATEPVSRRRFTHFGTQDGSMPNALPIDRIVSPASNRATARSRKSSE